MSRYTITKPENYVKPVMPYGKIWHEALVSGKFAQGRAMFKQYTKNGTAYCCLGVRAEVLGELTDCAAFKGEDFHSKSSLGFPEFSRWGSFPDGVFVVAKDEDDMDRTACDFTDLNDCLRLSFFEIAEILEELYIMGDESP